MAIFNSYVSLPEGILLEHIGTYWNFILEMLVGGFNHLEKYESQWEG
jgi:hypothetical protein